MEDDYGIAVIPEHFIDIVTGVDPAKFAGSTGRIGDEVLRRGFGYGVADPSTAVGIVTNNASKKRSLEGVVSLICNILYGLCRKESILALAFYYYYYFSKKKLTLFCPYFEDTG